ncbi:DUF4328 domain-containing protein [Nocardia asteroides]|uniref:DUF4328 domain-containing protein n=1 Tax=Nocardia asteroides TaxID=1824 RepID=UPI001E3CF38D|nr:DUF4328 domain-containing protein [Nocardia asteroides]UGT59349.1 DUF4328 domain-containing protein [Nocardia asteroides]
MVQPCARCGARWAVHGAPMHWCPRCRGVLLSPGPVDAPPERRNYRWVARKPEHRGVRGAGRPRAAAAPGTPSYAEIPRWGLLDTPAAPAAGPASRQARAAAAAGRLLLWTALAFALAALAELGRYAILLYNRTRLVAPLLLRVSDAAVLTFAVLACVLALLAAIAAVARLIELRAAAYVRVGGRDPRSPRTLLLGSLIPVLNLVWPGVFLTEALTGRDDPRALRLIRIWWVLWVLGGIAAVAALGWRGADSLQSKADGVLFTALTDLVAVAVALLTFGVLNALSGRDLRGRARSAHRLTVAVDPAVPVIAPLHRTEQPQSTADARENSAAGDNTGDEAGDREQEEVGAK